MTCKPFTRDEVQRLLDAAQTSGPRYLPALLMTAVRTGMRIGELLALQWGDFDLVEGFVDVQRQYSRERLTTLKRSKNRGKLRRVDLSPQLVETLERYRVQLKADALKAGIELSKWVFPGSSDDILLDVSKLRRDAWRKVQTKAKLRHRRIHDLRHTYASLMLTGGASITYVSEQLGHSSIRLTVDTYGHLVPGALRHEVARLDDADFRRGSTAQDGNPAATA